MQIYDFANGKLFWRVVYDESIMEETKRGIPSGYSGSKIKKSAVYKAVAEPLIDGNEVYVFDMHLKASSPSVNTIFILVNLFGKAKNLKNLLLHQTYIK